MVSILHSASETNLLSSLFSNVEYIEFPYYIVLLKLGEVSKKNKPDLVVVGFHTT